MVLQLTRPSAADVDDGTLARRIAGGDVRALDTAYDRFSRPVWSFALKVCGERELAEEVVQEAFVRLWQRAGRYDPARGKLLSWLLTITHHIAIDELRKRRARSLPDKTQAQLTALDEAIPDPSEAFGRIEEGEVVQRALSRLPESQRIPLQLAYYKGLTQAEIAGVLRTPLGTIKTRMRLGLLRLRALLSDVVDVVDVAGVAAVADAGGGRRMPPPALSLVAA